MIFPMNLDLRCLHYFLSINVQYIPWRVYNTATSESVQSNIYIYVRYAGLRRRLLIDPHIPKDGRSSSDLTMDNPLSQNPGNIYSFFVHLPDISTFLNLGD